MGSSQLEPSLPRLGIFHQLPEKLSVAVGRQVAVQQFAENLARHGRQHHFELFVPTMQVAAAREELEFDGGSASVHDLHRLHPSPDEFGFAGWHDMQLDTYRPFALRDRGIKPFPITLLHHSLSYKELLHEKFLRLLLSRPRSYDAVVCTSECAKRSLACLLDQVAEKFRAAYGPDISFRGRLEVIPLAADTKLFCPRDKDEARRKFGIPDNAFVMLWVGRLSAIDKADLLPWILILRDLIGANPDRELLLVCAGTQRPGERYGEIIENFARQLGIANRLRILGGDRATLHFLYPAADVFVSPADNMQETFGITPVEAMACGVPQVVSDWNGYRETVVHGSTGFLVETYTGRFSENPDFGSHFTETPFDHLVLAQSVVVDPAALRDSLQKLISNESLRTEMSAASRRRALECFSWSPIVDRYEELWSELGSIARKTPEHNETLEDYAAPNYLHAFAHYPSRLLSEDARVVLSKAGRRLIAGELGLPLYFNNEWQYLDAGILKRIMEGVVKLDAKGQPLSIGRIMGVISRGAPGDQFRSRVFRHVLWLLKYGFVKLE